MLNRSVLACVLVVTRPFKRIAGVEQAVIKVPSSGAWAGMIDSGTSEPVGIAGPLHLRRALVFSLGEQSAT